VIGRGERKRTIQQACVEEDLRMAVDVRVDHQLELGAPREREDGADGAAGRRPSALSASANPA
jgi:hypothetical protein